MSSPYNATAVNHHNGDDNIYDNNHLPKEAPTAPLFHQAPTATENAAAPPIIFSSAAAAGGAAAPPSTATTFTATTTQSAPPPKQRPHIATTTTTATQQAKPSAAASTFKTSHSSSTSHNAPHSTATDAAVVLQHAHFVAFLEALALKHLCCPMCKATPMTRPHTVVKKKKNVARTILVEEQEDGELETKHEAALVGDEEEEEVCCCCEGCAMEMIVGATTDSNGNSKPPRSNALSMRPAPMALGGICADIGDFLTTVQQHDDNTKNITSNSDQDANVAAFSRYSQSENSEKAAAAKAARNTTQFSATPEAARALFGNGTSSASPDRSGMQKKQQQSSNTSASVFRDPTAAAATTAPTTAGASAEKREKQQQQEALEAQQQQQQQALLAQQQAQQQQMMDALLGLLQDEMNARAGCYERQSVAFLDLSRQFAVRLKHVRVARKGCARQLKVEADDKYEQGDFERAVRLYSKSIVRVKSFGDTTAREPVLFGNRSAALFMAGRYEACIRDCLHVATTLEPHNVKLYNRAIRSALMLGDLDKALAIHQLVPDGAPGAASLRTREMADEMTKIASACEAWKQVKPETGSSGGNSSKFGTPEGDALLQLLMNQFPDTLPFRCRLAESYAAQGRLDRAVEVLTAVAATHPATLPNQPQLNTPPMVAVLLAKCHYMSGFECFEQARKLLVALGEQQQQNNAQTREMERQLRNSGAGAGDDDKGDDEYSSKSDVYSAEDRALLFASPHEPHWAAAHALLQRLNSVDDAKQHGNALFSQRQFAQSVTHYTAAIDADPSNGRILRILYCNRAAACKELGRLQDGVDDCTRAIELDATFSKAYARRARCRMLLRQFDGAVADFSQASSFDPTDRELLRELRAAEEGLARELEREKDPYHMLGVTRAALREAAVGAGAGSAGEAAVAALLKQRFRALSLQLHPDKCHGQSEDERRVSERRFKAVLEAYGTLSNADARRQHDLRADAAAARSGPTSSAYYGAGGGPFARSSAGAAAAGAGAAKYTRPRHHAAGAPPPPPSAGGATFW